MPRVRLHWGLLILLACATPSLAQTPAGQDPEPPETTVDEIIVVGGTLEDRAANFVEQVARPARGRGIARWAGPACIGVMNFRRPAAEYIADKLVANADDLGIPISDVAGCEPNIFVVGAVDASAVATEWVSENREDFRPVATEAHAGERALEHFMTTDAPVRWWHVSIPMHYDIATGRAAPTRTMAGQVAFPIFVYSKSLLASRIRDDLMRVVIIVDLDRMGSVTIDQLCDYLTVVAFAQIDPLADTTAYPTILNVFTDTLGSPGLTEWDRTYLTAMYDAVPDRRLNPRQQAAHLADQLRAGEEGR